MVTRPQPSPLGALKNGNDKISRPGHPPSDGYHLAGGDGADASGVGGDRVADGPGLESDLAEQPRQLHLDAGEVEAWRRWQSLRTVHQRSPVLVEHAQVAHDRIEAGAVAGGAYHRVGSQHCAVDQLDFAARQAFHRREDTDPPTAELADEPVVEDRHRPRAQELREPVTARGRQPVGAQVGNADPAQRGRQRVHQALRHSAQRDAEQLAGDPEGVPSDDVRGRAHGQGYGDSRSRQIDRDLRRRVASADHKYVLAEVGVGAHVVRRVHERELDRIGLGRPFGEVRAVAETGSHHNGGGSPRAVGRLHDPAVALAVDAGDLDAELRSHAIGGCVVTEVVDHVVAGDPPAVPAGDPGAGKARQPADRVQVQAVVASRPGGPDRRVAFEEVAVDAMTVEGRSDGQPGRSGTDDHRTLAHAGILCESTQH